MNQHVTLAINSVGKLYRPPLSVGHTHNMDREVCYPDTCILCCCACLSLQRWIMARGKYLRNCTHVIRRSNDRNRENQLFRWNRRWNITFTVSNLPASCIGLCCVCVNSERGMDLGNCWFGRVVSDHFTPCSYWAGWGKLVDRPLFPLH